MGIEDAKYRSAQYYLVDKGGGFAVYQQKPVTVIKTSASQAGVQQQQLEYRSLADVVPSVFEAISIGSGQWEADAYAGAQRWRGTVSTSQVKKALWDSGFFEADAIIQLYRKKPDRS